MKEETYCIHCYSAKSTAQAWKLKCTNQRHKFAKGRLCENCLKEGGVADFRNYGVIWVLCKKCADLPIKKLKNKLKS